MSEKTVIQVGEASYEVPTPIAQAMIGQIRALIAAKQMQDELVAPNVLMDDSGTQFNVRSELTEDAFQFFKEAPVGVYRQPLNGYRWLGEFHFVWRKSESGDPVLQGVVIPCLECAGSGALAIAEDSTTRCTNCGGGGEIVSLEAVPDHFSSSNQSGAH